MTQWPLQRRRPTAMVVVVLIAAALGTVATSEPGVWLTASVPVNAIDGPSRVRFDFTMGRLDWYEAGGSGPRFLELYLRERNPNNPTPEAHWRIMTPDGSSVVRRGGFMAGAPGDASGSVARMGRVCTGDEVGMADCIPCDLSAGCVLDVDLEVCGSASGHRLFARMAHENGRVVRCDSCGDDLPFAITVTAGDYAACESDDPEPDAGVDSDASDGAGGSDGGE